MNIVTALKSWIQFRYRLFRLWLRQFMFRRKLQLARLIWRATVAIQKRLRPFLLKHEPELLYPKLPDRYSRPLEDRHGGRLPR